MINFFLAPILVEFNKKYSGEIYSNNSRYLKIPFSSEGISIDIQVETGKVEMFGVCKNPHPDGINHECRNEEIQEGKTAHVSIPYKDKAEQAFYLHLLGKETSKVSVMVMDYNTLQLLYN